MCAGKPLILFFRLNRAALVRDRSFMRFQTLRPNRDGAHGKKWRYHSPAVLDSRVSVTLEPWWHLRRASVCRPFNGQAEARKVTVLDWGELVRPGQIEIGGVVAAIVHAHGRAANQVRGSHDR